MAAASLFRSLRRMEVVNSSLAAHRAEGVKYSMCRKSKRLLNLYRVGGFKCHRSSNLRNHTYHAVSSQYRISLSDQSRRNIDKIIQVVYMYMPSCGAHVESSMKYQIDFELVGIIIIGFCSSKPYGNEVMGMVKNEARVQREKLNQGTKALIGIKLTSFDGRFMGIPAHTKKVGLPESRVVYTVLRSPHIDKKSREQFEMRIKKLYLVIKTDSHELRNKYFWLKRQRIFGAQFEINFFCKTRLDKSKLDGLLGR